MKAAGAPAVLTYHTNAQVDAGDVIETTTGRRYLVTRARRTTGRDRYWRCDTIVMAPSDPTPQGARVHRLKWYPRDRRSR